MNDFTHTCTHTHSDIFRAIRKAIFCKFFETLWCEHGLSLSHQFAFCLQLYQVFKPLPMFSEEQQYSAPQLSGCLSPPRPPKKAADSILVDLSVTSHRINKTPHCISSTRIWLQSSATCYLTLCTRGMKQLQELKIPHQWLPLHPDLLPWNSSARGSMGCFIYMLIMQSVVLNVGPILSFLILSVLHLWLYCLQNPEQIDSSYRTNILSAAPLINFINPLKQRHNVSYSL